MIKDTIKKFLPKAVFVAFSRIKRLFRYSNYDSTAYWKGRASDEGQAAVLWENQEYNDLYRKLQREILCPYIFKLNRDKKVLDIGCGVGVVSNMLADINPGILIDAVDFDEMISVAKKNSANDRIKFVPCSAESYLQHEYKYSVVLSSGCYSAIRNISDLEQSLRNAVLMLEPGGIVLMIDPFHRWNYLARAKYGSSDVIGFMESQGLVLIEKSGVLFWPFREFLAGSQMTGNLLERRFFWGEKILQVLGKHFWADYKVLVFRK